MVHTSPLEQAGIGDAGGMNIYVVESAKKMVAAGVGVDIFTRATKPNLPKIVEIAPGVRTIHIDIDQYESLSKEQLPYHVNEISHKFLETVENEKLDYDLIHSHYWLSGKVALNANQKLKLPLVQTMHTMALVKNMNLAEQDKPEPEIRIQGEVEVVQKSDAIIANTEAEASSLVTLYEACPEKVHVVSPGVDLDTFSAKPTTARAINRKQLGIPDNAVVLSFVGRLQPHKGPDILVKALANLFDHNPHLKSKVYLLIIGGSSGNGSSGKLNSELDNLINLSKFLGINSNVKFVPPVNRNELPDWYKTSDIVCVPSYSESFGLVALEAQACGIPVVATAVGGLRTAVADGISGSLIDGHDPRAWSSGLLRLIQEPSRRTIYSYGAIQHSSHFGWMATSREILGIYDELLSARKSNLAGA